MITKPKLYSADDSSILFTDTETFSDVDLKKSGTVKYTDSAELMLAGFKLGDKYEVYDKYEEGSRIPVWVKQHVAKGGLIAAHNALFDYGILSKVLHDLRIDQMVDTMAMTSAHGLPMGLAKAGKALGIDEDKQKIKDGARLIKKFCMPRKATKNNPDTRNLPKDHPEDWDIFKNEYLRNDIYGMEDIYNILSPLSDNEHQVWVDTQNINLSGIPVDLETSQLIIDKLDILVDDESSKFIRLTSLFPTQRDKVLQWVKSQGVKIDNLQAATVQGLLDSATTPQIVKDALAARANTTHMSFKKFPVIMAASRKGGVVSGTLMYHVAHTGRFGGRLLQPQNLTRGTIDGVEAVERIQAGEFNVELVKSCVRPMIYHEDGFTIVDWASIEARGLQWAAGDQESMEIFRQGVDSYKWMAARIYDVEYDDVTDKQRFCGKQAILGLGYQMSAKTFIEMIEGYGETMPMTEAKLAVEAYRDVHKKVVLLWASMQSGAAMALQRPGKTILVNKRISYTYIGEFLHMNLPSGRAIKYFQPRLEDSWGKATFSYMGTNDKNQYVRIKTYGGKLTENYVQAISRDILVDSVSVLMDMGHRVVTHIHDEIVLLGTHDVQTISDIMCIPPEWADGFPLAAEGFNSPRYKKG